MHCTGLYTTVKQGKAGITSICLLYFTVQPFGHYHTVPSVWQSTVKRTSLEFYRTGAISAELLHFISNSEETKTSPRL
jgi:hypothetical protein